METESRKMSIFFYMYRINPQRQRFIPPANISRSVTEMVKLS